MTFPDSTPDIGDVSFLVLSQSVVFIILQFFFPKNQFFISLMIFSFDFLFSILSISARDFLLDFVGLPLSLSLFLDVET